MAGSGVERDHGCSSDEDNKAGTLVVVAQECTGFSISELIDQIRDFSHSKEVLCL